MNLTERIKKVIEKEGNNPSIFADVIGISRSSMNHILNGRNNPSLDVLTKILTKYENINSDWLLFGKQPMYRGEKAFLQPSLFDEIEPEQPKVQAQPEYPKEIEVKQPEIDRKPLSVVDLPIKEVSSKKIAKIMIFYSDNTFDSFTPDDKGF